jgi:hypothetical protein
MSPLEYLGSALDDWPVYVGLAVLFLMLHSLLIQRWTVGIYDPLFLLLVSNAMGWAIVWFMYLRGEIAPAYVVSFSAAQLALYLGMGTARALGGRRPIVRMPVAGAAQPQLTLIFATAVHVGSNLTIWALAGIPLLRDSRLGAFQGSGGLGILERLAESSGLIALFSAVFLVLRWPRLRRNPAMVAFWIWYLAAVATSGSKGAFLTLVQCVLSIAFVYGGLRWGKDRFWGGHAGKWLVVMATLFALAVLSLQQQGDVGLAGLGLLYRIVSYGDVYIFAYPDATIESLKGGNPLVGMFGGFLSTFRLFPQELLHDNLGYQLAGIIFPGLDLVVGPNPQHPVFGYHYFGALGFVFSFVLGLLTMALHTRFFFRQHSSFLTGLLAFLLYFGLVSISVDFDYSMSKLASMVIGLIVIVGPWLLLYPKTAILRRRTRSPTATAAKAAA